MSSIHTRRWVASAYRKEAEVRRVYAVGECELRELRNKSEAEIIALLDKKTGELSKTFAGQYVLKDRIGDG